MLYKIDKAHRVELSMHTMLMQLTHSLNTLQSDKFTPVIQGRSKETQPEAVNSTEFSPLSSPEHIQMVVHS